MPFQLFGTAHLLALSVIAALALGLPLLLRRRAPGMVTSVAWLLGALLLAQEVAQAAWLWRSLGLSLHLLPLDLCTLSVFLTAWVLIARSPRIYEVVYFWGLGGTTQALVTPELSHGFPSAAFLFFFAGHGLVVIGVVYATFALRLRPYPRSILRVAAMTLALAAAVFLLNLLLGTNFMYLMAKPMQPSLLDWFGPWPWYLAGLFLTALLTFAVLYLPWVVVDFRRSHRTPPSEA
jgi:hypothetical integral membrane protein (TIGR02206 family)